MEEKKQLELIRRIASVVGHELRNPLAVINNSAYFLKTKLGGDGRLDPKVDRHLTIVTSEIARLDGMIADILTFPRPLELKTARAPLNAAVAQALKDYRAPDKIAVAPSFCAEDPSVALEPAALADALRRLLDNAADAMPEGGTVTVRTTVQNGAVALEVRDGGAGFKPEALPMLFAPFFSTKPRGLGLGLAMARKFCQAQGAAISAENAPGGGAAVRISWPG